MSNPAGKLLLRGAMAHWKAIGSPTCTFRTKTLPCLPGRSDDGQFYGVGPPADNLVGWVSFWRSAFKPLTVDNADTVSVDSDQVTVDRADRFPRKGDLLILGQVEYQVEMTSWDVSGTLIKCKLSSPNN